MKNKVKKLYILLILICILIIRVDNIGVPVGKETEWEVWVTWEAVDPKVILSTSWE